MTHRVVVTGMGALTPVGNTVDETWSSLKSGKSGIARTTLIDPEPQASQVAGEVKEFDPANYMDKKAARKMARFTQLFIAAGKEAIEDSEIISSKFYDPYQIATILGNGIGGFEILEEATRRLVEKGVKGVPPLAIPMLITNEGPANLAMIHGLKGPCYSVVTACASGTDAIGTAFHSIRKGDISAAVVGGTESTITVLGYACFAKLQTLSTAYNDTPEKACRPFDKGRDGFIMAEGSGVLVLETLENAIKRNAKIYAEVLGYGATCDAYHLTSPCESGEHTAKAMSLAMEDGNVEPSEINYINAHGTSTQINDPTETRAIKMALGESAAYKVPISSTKSMTGHMIGGTGAVEIISCIKAIEDSFVPPTINIEDVEESCDLDYVPNVGRAVNVDIALSNSLGFGGHNASVVVKKFKE